MSSSGWQIQVGDDLSKAYSLDQLRRKHTKGVIADDVMCTQDRGRTFVPLESVLSESTRPKPQTARRLGKLNRVSRLKPTAEQAKAILPETTEAGLHPPSGSSSGIQPPSTVSAIFRTPKLPSKPKPTQPILNDLIADAVEAAQARTIDEEPEAEAEAEIESETYTIPAPPPPTVEPAPKPTVDFYERQPSPGAQAAAELLGRQEAEETEFPPRRRLSSSPPAEQRIDTADDESDDVIPVFGEIPEPRPLHKRPIAVVTILLGITAVGIMLWWQRGDSGPPRFEELTGTSLNFASNEPASLEELNARTQILGVRIGQIQRAIGSQDTIEDLDIPELPSTPRLPLVPFHQRPLTAEEQRLAENHLQKYGNLVQRSADGRKHEDATIRTHTQYLKDLVALTNGRSSSRSDALHEVAEFTKLIYLLQLKHIHSKNADRRAEAETHILEAGDIGLSKLYSEVRTGDMRFAEVLERESPAEQSRLLLVRYWHHRSVDRTSANAWLQASLKIIDEDHHAYVNSSIAEVNRIEGN